MSENIQTDMEILHQYQRLEVLRANQIRSINDKQYDERWQKTRMIDVGIGVVEMIYPILSQWINFSIFPMPVSKFFYKENEEWLSRPAVTVSRMLKCALTLEMTDVTIIEMISHQIIAELTYYKDSGCLVGLYVPITNNIFGRESRCMDPEITVCRRPAMMRCAYLKIGA